MPRYMSFLVLFLPLACGSPKSDQAPANPHEIDLARLFIEKMENDTGYRLGLNNFIQYTIDREKVDTKALLRGSIQLLKDGEEEERKKAAHFLGRLGDKGAVEPLVDVLTDPNESIRESACYGLQWLHVKGAPAEPLLVRLRAKDPSVDVRVAAAFALGRPPDEKSIAAFKEGIELTQNHSVRSSCENELESIGKLELPLPEKVYAEISRERYQEFLNDPRWYTIQRKRKKGDILYFEVVENARHVLLIPTWYRVKLD